MDSQLCSTVQNRLETVYGIRVITRDIRDPLTGDLNGAEIHVDHAVTAEQRLFLLGHLFGHTVQWNTDAHAYDLGQPRTAPVDAALIPALMQYEVVAGQYALQLFHEAGIAGHDQWLADYTACAAPTWAATIEPASAGHSANSGRPAHH